MKRCKCCGQRLPAEWVGDENVGWFRQDGRLRLRCWPSGLCNRSLWYVRDETVDEDLAHGDEPSVGDAKAAADEAAWEVRYGKGE